MALHVKQAEPVLVRLAGNVHHENVRGVQTLPRKKTTNC